MLALVGLGILVFWVSRSQRTQFSLINSAASPYNTGDPAKTDKKLHNMGMNKRLLPSLSFGKKESRKEVAKINNAAKFPAEIDFIESSQHEVYTRHKGAVAASEQEKTLLHQSVPTGQGDRHDIVVPGEKLEVY